LLGGIRLDLGRYLPSSFPPGPPPPIPLHKNRRCYDLVAGRKERWAPSPSFFHPVSLFYRYNSRAFSYSPALSFFHLSPLPPTHSRRRNLLTPQKGVSEAFPAAFLLSFDPFPFPVPKDARKCLSKEDGWQRRGSHRHAWCPSPPLFSPFHLFSPPFPSFIPGLYCTMNLRYKSSTPPSPWKTPFPFLLSSFERFPPPPFFLFPLSFSGAEPKVPRCRAIGERMRL